MPFNPEAAAARVRTRNKREEIEIKRRSTIAIEKARNIALEIGARDIEVKRVVLFGSLAEGVPRRLDFDIDLAIDGGDIYLAMDAADASEIRVDLLDMNRISEHIRARIAAKGIVLYRWRY